MTEPLPPVTELERYVRRYAACRGQSEKFLANNDATRASVQRLAECRAICASCPALSGCRTLVDYIEFGQNDRQALGGFWAGESASARERRRREGRALHDSAA